jgi:NADH-quinone oxidoreductase subunit E
MAWVAKPSGTMKIARREQPYLTREMQDRLTKDVLPRYETTLGALMPTLHEVQHAYGWIPAQAMEEIAAFLQIKPADVYDCASFYEEFWLEPKGRHTVAVCRSIACEFCGQPEVTEACRRELGVDLGETTKDGAFTLIELECLGACGGAPAILIDEKLHENVKPEQVARLLDDAARNGAKHH